MKIIDRLNSEVNVKDGKIKIDSIRRFASTRRLVKAKVFQRVTVFFLTKLFNNGIFFLSVLIPFGLPKGSKLLVLPE